MTDKRMERAHCSCHPRNRGHKYDDGLVCFGCGLKWPQPLPCPTPKKLTAEDLGAMGPPARERRAGAAT